MSLGFASIVVATLAAGMPGPTAYTLAPIEAHVFDEETGEALGGVLAIAHWVLDGPNGNRVGTLRLDEAITDEKGRIFFPGLGPISRPMKGVLDMQDPELIIFKPGYTVAGLVSGADSAPDSRRWIAERKSDWDKRRIPLKKRPSDEERYVLQIRLQFIGLARVFIERECLWKAIPRALVIMDEENRRQRSAGVISPGVPSMADLKAMNCGLPDG